MFASTQFFAASPLFGATPSAWTCSVTPDTTGSDAAWIDVVPGVGELITTVHEPVAPTVEQLAGPTKAAVAPFAFVSVKLITVPAGAFVKFTPSIETFTCPVSVWFVPTSFDACNGLIWMFACGFCQILFAFGLSPGRPSPVALVRSTPPTSTVVAALMSVLPAVGELIVTVQDPVPPAVVQVFAPAGTKTAEAPALFVSENVITVPSGAFTKPAPFPASTLTWPVSVWLVFTGFVAFCGVIWMFALTQVFVASPEFGATPFVSIVNGAEPFTDNVADAW